jgi:hypothetical protein
MERKYGRRMLRFKSTYEIKQELDSSAAALEISLPKIPS